MLKTLLSLTFNAALLASCISISVESGDVTPRPNFVTATLGPTQQGFVPATLTPAPEPTQTPAVTGSTSANCSDSAVLLRDVTIPDNTQVNPGETFIKTWEFQNNGDCPWTDYTVRFTAGDQMSAPVTAPIQTTFSGGKVNVSVELTAPISNGTYTGYFTLNDPAGNEIPIGIEKTFWVKILVGNPVPEITIQAVINTPYVPDGGNSNCAYGQNAGYVQQLVGMINQARAAAGLQTLVVNAQLRSAAQAHSADMACNNFLGHTGSNGSWIGDRLKAAGYNTYSYQEIIAIGTPQNAMDQWAADPPHWESVLSPYISEIGVGYAYYSDSDFGGYITVDFAGP
jgi:uncharacterized protein YkwD